MGASWQSYPAAHEQTTKNFAIDAWLIVGGRCGLCSGILITRRLVDRIKLLKDLSILIERLQVAHRRRFLGLTGGLPGKIGMGAASGQENPRQSARHQRLHPQTAAVE